jgi:hypothetical protein
MGNVTWPQIVTAVVAVLALAVTLYNFYQQYTASKGGVRFVISNFKWEDSTPEHLSYTLLIHGFNQRDTYTGARNIFVKFFKEGEEIVRTRLRDVVDGYYADFLNFPPNEWVAKMYRGEVAVDAADYDGPKRLERYNEARLVIQLPHAYSEIRVPLDGGEVEKIVGGFRRSQEREEWVRT